MIYFFMLIVLPLLVALISPRFLSKRFISGKENSDTLSEMEVINRRVSHFMSTFYTPMNNYSINIVVKDGKVHKIVTGTELTEKILQCDSDKQTTNQKAFSPKTLKLGIAIYMFLLTFIISFLILIPITK